jgi:hypothetical protein
MSGWIIGNLCLFKYNNPSFLNIFYPSLCADAANYNTYLSNLSILANAHNISNSWLDIKDWFKGIVLDNNNPDNDFLKYDFDPSVLSWSFVIEMQVRGADLKRSWTYYLFNTWDVYLDLHLNYLYLWHSWFTNVKKIHKSVFDENKLYTIQAIFEWSDWDIKIPGTSITANSVNWWTGVSSTDIYIWSNKSSSQQWNGVIDYVKIYKKNN